ncbi:HEAT repeat domain-containing protein [Legionella oakridgensis]|uniref:HEAT repeat protein n=2 Tax=Legionella oakridgensis TaxID=29423 RepID=A0A0W0WZX9_9GAMM|nr:HEAT repeat domain-containing protein [Legionella oakridgensis]KTD37832.1 HEAT repeat protein [Legionella oakridgensis]STY19715.1 HEAT repeat [Legionella longbeachae]
MYSTDQLIVIYFISVEFCLVLLFIVLVYFIKFYNILKKRIIEKKSQQYAIMLQAYAQDGRVERFSQLDNYEQLLLQLKSSNLTEKKKKKLIAAIILPKLIRHIKANDWSKRYRLLSCFRIYLDETYYPILTQLIQDSVSIISINAAHIGYQTNNEKIHQAILTRLLVEDYASRTLYIRNFKANQAMWPFFLNQLEQTKNTLLKKIIYDILHHTGCDSRFFSIAKEDSLQGEKNTQLAAIRVLPYTGDDKDVLDVLKILLNNDSWRVRNIAVQSLAVLNDPEIIPLLADQLNDKNVWVKTSAAKMLTLTGNEGLQVLKAKKKNAPKQIADYASYFLDIAEIRRAENA